MSYVTLMVLCILVVFGILCRRWPSLIEVPFLIMEFLHHHSLLINCMHCLVLCSFVTIHGIYNFIIKRTAIMELYAL